jgi:hypothetical protein
MLQIKLPDYEWRTILASEKLNYINGHTVTVLLVGCEINMADAYFCIS